MGQHTHVEVVPFKIETSLEGDDNCLMKTPLGKAILEGQQGSDDEPNKAKGFHFAGWDEVPDPKGRGWPKAWCLGKKGTIYGKPIRKGNMEIYCQNESEYESVGEYEISFVANKRKDLVAFCKDVGLNPKKIEETSTLKWTT